MRTLQYVKTAFGHPNFTIRQYVKTAFGYHNSKCQSLFNSYRAFANSSCSDKPKVAPTITLNDGRKMPQIGLGTWLSKPGQVEQAVTYTFSIGYRHLDCAYVYENEKEVGSAICHAISDGIVKRDDLWITTKLWNNFHRPEVVCKACELSLKNLGLDYIDLYLIHWPMGYKENWDNLFLKDPEKVVFSDVDYVDTWKAMEQLCKLGLVKSIGLSNFNKRQIERVLKVADILPVVNQVECHPYLIQTKLIEFCNCNKINITGYSPLGSPIRLWAKPDEPVLLEDPKLKEIVKNYECKTLGQILLRFQIELGNSTVPKSVTNKHIKANFEIFDFKLSDEDLKKLKAMDRGFRYVAFPEMECHPHHPFVNDEY